MKLLKSNRMKSVLVGIVAAMVVSGGNAKADFTFGEPVNLGPTINSPHNECYSIISVDGLELYFNSARPGVNSSSWDIYVAKRATIDDDWGTPVCLGSNVNTSRDEYMPRLSPDGLELYYDVRNRPGGYGNFDTWVNRRPTKDSAWGPAENFGPIVNTAGGDGTVWITNDGLELYFSSARPSSGLSPAPIYVSTRATTEDDWGDPVRLGPPVDGPSIDLIASVSADGLALFINEDELFGRYRPDGYGGTDIWLTTRANRSSPWGVPVNLGPIINTSGHEAGGCVSPDGSALYFDASHPEGYGKSDLYQAPIIPIVDFNSDGIADVKDVVIMTEHWGENYSLCDIGPTPLGDGIVDIQDLVVLTEYIEPINRTLIAHWALDEAEGDIAYNSINDNHGIISGNPTWQTNSGQVNGALEFDGIDDYVSTPFVLNPGEVSFSASAWIRGGAPGQVIISQADVEGQSALESGGTWLGISQSDGRLMTGLMAIFFGPLESESVVADGQWHHVGLVYDYTTMKRHLYVDGAQVAVDAGVVAGVQSTAGLYIGAGQTLDAASFFSGLIDDVRIYDVALTAEEIAALAQ